MNQLFYDTLHVLYINYEKYEISWPKSQLYLAFCLVWTTAQLYTYISLWKIDYNPTPISINLGPASKYTKISQSNTSIHKIIVAYLTENHPKHDPSYASTTSNVSVSEKSGKGDCYPWEQNQLKKVI